MIKVWRHLDYQATEYKFVFPKNEPNRKEAPPTWVLCNVLTDSELEAVARAAFEAGSNSGNSAAEGKAGYFMRKDFDAFWEGRK